MKESEAAALRPGSGQWPTRCHKASVEKYYDDNDATAILSNYLNEPENEKYKNEFIQLQACRSLAKTLAKTIIEENIY